jgi:hypothetical protein
MSDEGQQQSELKKLEDDLKRKVLSRRNFLNRLSAVGVGFGAALALGLRRGEAATPADGGVEVSSTHPAIDNVLSEAKNLAETPPDAEEPLQKLAQYGRFYRRGYRRFYRRYGRFYRRGYRRFYRRYGRFYPRFYARF